MPLMLTKILHTVNMQYKMVKMTYETVKKIEIHVKTIPRAREGAVHRIKQVTEMEDYFKMQASLEKTEKNALYVSFKNYTLLSGKY